MPQTGYRLLLGLQNEELLPEAVAAEFQQLISALQTQFVGQLADISNPPRAKIFLGATQSIPDSTETFVNFVPARVDNMEEFDSHSMYDQNSLAFSISQAGLYILQAHIIWTPTAGASRTLAFAQKNGIFESFHRDAGSATQNNEYYSIPLQVKQSQVDTGPVKIGVRVFQASGGAIDITTNSWFAIHRVAKL